MGRVLLITGSTGIAEATALKASDRGDSIFVISRNEAHCLDLCARLADAGYYACDLADEHGVEDALTACFNRFGGVDAVFNVAGISGRSFGDGPLHECSTEGWTITLDSNLKSMFLVCRGVLKHWLAAGREGNILNMSSVLAFAPEAQYFATHAYAATKGAIISMSRAMAAYYAPHRIRVNVIAPALVRTPMSGRAQSDPQLLKYIAHKQPLSGGMLQADDVARAALFLLSEESRQMTGQVITVDGGWTVAG